MNLKGLTIFLILALVVVATLATYRRGYRGYGYGKRYRRYGGYYRGYKGYGRRWWDHGGYGYGHKAYRPYHYVKPAPIVKTEVREVEVVKYVPVVEKVSVPVKVVVGHDYGYRYGRRGYKYGRHG